MTETRTVQDWGMPIETAPMDGTAIWLLVDGQLCLGYGEPANWGSAAARWLVKAAVSRRNGIYREGITDRIYCCYDLDVNPTRWMPLPDVGFAK